MARIWQNTQDMDFSSVSLFDLDNTLLTVNSSYSFGKYLYKRKEISLFSLLYLIACYAMHKAGAFSISSLQHIAFQHFFQGRSADSLQILANDFVDQNFEHILYPPAVQRLYLAQQQGHRIFILSSSPDFLVEIFAKKFAVDGWEASHYAVDDGKKFTKISRILHGSDKAYYIHSLLENYKISRDNVIAYTDSHLDLPFLKASGKPIGVNPDKKLHAICRQNRWEII